MPFLSIEPNRYCDGCRWWQHFGGSYGCKRFGVYKYDEFRSLCNGRFRE